MLDNILNLVKDTVSKELTTSDMVPQEKQQQAVETTTHALADGLKDNLNIGNLANIMNLFKGNQPVNNNPIVGNLQNNVISSLIQKVGLPQNTANMIATAIVPIVMKAISGKVQDPNEKGFDVQSLIQAFGGNNAGDSKVNILGSIGKMFGR